ncbi:MAG: hypothetical protein ACOC5T_07305 [Elusimicrobiota bacterium]
MNINKEELAELSGENDTMKPGKTFYPSLRINGNKGHLYIERRDDETEETFRENIGEEEKGVFLVVTKKLFRFDKERYFWTPEYRGRNTDTVLFKSEDGKTTKIDEGMSRELKEKENLKTMYVIYMLREDDEVVKLQVKGKGLGSLFEYFDEKDSHMFETVTKIGTEVEEGKLGEYYYLTFEQGEAVEDLENVAEKIKSITSELDELEDYYEEQEEKKLEEEKDMAGFGSKPPVESYDESEYDNGNSEQPTRDDLEDPFEMM